MKALAMVGAMALLVVGVYAATATRSTVTPSTNGIHSAELKSGLELGDLVGPFDVEKCGGAVNDGKEVGANFCYRCMLGNKPVVMIFARTPDESLGSLVQQLDKKLAENDDQKLSSFVNLLGPDQEAAKALAKEFAAKNKLENVALVVPHEHANGPQEFGINPEADVTATIYRNGKVVVAHALAKGQLNAAAIKTILDDTKKILD